MKYDNDGWLYKNNEDVRIQQEVKNIETCGGYQAKVTGDQGELVLSSVLKSLPECYHVMNNILIKTKQGSTQIDHVIVSPYGLFVVETKNYKGMIFGDMVGKVWTQVLSNGHFTVYSPVLQNAGHIRHLSKAIQVSSNFIYGAIVFTSGQVNLSNVACPFCYTVDMLYDCILSFNRQIFSDKEVIAIIRRIDKVNSSSYENDLKHIEYVKQQKQKYSRNTRR